MVEYSFVEQTNIAGPIKAQIMEPTHLAPDGGEPKADTEDVDTDGGASRRQESWGGGNTGRLEDNFWNGWKMIKKG